MRDRVWFVRMYGQITPELSRVDYRPYRWSNHALSYLYHDIPCRPYARYEIPYAQELGTCIWGPCYNSTLCPTEINVICATGKNIKPRFRFKIKASYIVSTEGDVQRVTVLAIEAT